MCDINKNYEEKNGTNNIKTKKAPIHYSGFFFIFII